jgi:uncharacterized protein YnzC (UPF0291/DUF896 family)
MSNMAKWVPLVKKLARKHKAVNLVYTAEDLEQEAWINIINYWPKIQGLTDVEIEKNIKTIFKRKVIDIIRSQMRRPDTHWSFKSNVIDPLGRTVAAGQVARTRPMGEAAERTSPEDEMAPQLPAEPKLAGKELPAPTAVEPAEGKKPRKEIKLNPIRVEAGRFTSEIHGPEEVLAAEGLQARVLAWAQAQVQEAREELEDARAFRARTPGRAAEKDVRESEQKLEAAGFSLRIIEALLDDAGSADKTNGRDVCKALGIPSEHWTRTVRQLQEALEAA